MIIVYIISFIYFFISACVHYDISSTKWRSGLWFGNFLMAIFWPFTLFCIAMIVIENPSNYNSK